LLNVDVMDGAHSIDERGDAGACLSETETLEKHERAIDNAASRDPNDSMVGIRCTKPPIIGISSSYSPSPDSMVGGGVLGSMVSACAMTAADDRGCCWVRRLLLLALALAGGAGL
jgi:hypothetical protein